MLLVVLYYNPIGFKETSLGMFKATKVVKILSVCGLAIEYGSKLILY